MNSNFLTQAEHAQYLTISKALSNRVQGSKLNQLCANACLSSIKLDQILSDLAQRCAARELSTFTITTDNDGLTEHLLKPFYNLYSTRKEDTEKDAAALAGLYNLSSSDLLNNAEFWNDDCDRDQFARAIQKRQIQAAAPIRSAAVETVIPDQPTRSDTRRILIEDQPPPAAIEAAAAPKSNKKGRPRGSKNKKNIKRTAAVYLIGDDYSNFEPAVLDLLWSQNGLIASEIIKRLTIPAGTIKRAYYELDRIGAIEKRKSGSTKEGRPIYRYYAKTARRGWFYESSLCSVRELAKIARLSISTMHDRLKKYQNAFDAINEPRLESYVR
jgi:DNA-binding transcriptional regulator YhcF (GntR family)